MPPNWQFFEHVILVPENPGILLFGCPGKSWKNVLASLYERCNIWLLHQFT